MRRRHPVPEILAVLGLMSCAMLQGRAADVVTTAETTVSMGKAVYTNCSACHGAQGQGRLGPRFKGDADLARTDYVIRRIVNGGGVMPAFRAQLNDAEIASVATFIRTRWGNHFGPVSEAEVARWCATAIRRHSKTASRLRTPATRKTQ